MTRIAALDIGDLDPDPFVAVRAWLDAAIASGLAEPNAMTLATAGATGRPSARTVLLKDVDAGGFVWFTNALSRKGQDLRDNPRAAIVLVWTALRRQIGALGPVERLAPEESDAYFATRDRGSQLGAWASPQSQLLPDRAALDDRLRAVTERYAGGPVPRPPHWGGYRLRPTEIEFWAGQPNRLHDRLRYRREGEGWIVERLGP